MLLELLILKQGAHSSVFGDVGVDRAHNLVVGLTNPLKGLSPQLVVIDLLNNQDFIGDDRRFTKIFPFCIAGLGLGLFLLLH